MPRGTGTTTVCERNGARLRVCLKIKGPLLRRGLPQQLLQLLYGVRLLVDCFVAFFSFFVFRDGSFNAGIGILLEMDLKLRLFVLVFGFLAFRVSGTLDLDDRGTAVDAP